MEQHEIYQLETFYAKYGKRIFDIAVALVLLIILFPFMLLVLLVLLVTTGRPVFLHNKNRYSPSAIYDLEAEDYGNANCCK